MAKVWSFVKRDVALTMSYRLSFVFQFAGILLTVASFYFLSKFVGGAVESLPDYGSDYFSYVLLGLTFTVFMTIGMQTFSEKIREGQLTGTLEIMLLSPTRLSTILLASSVWEYVFGLLRVFLFVLAGAVVFGADFSHVNPGAAFVVLLLSIVSFASIGMISAAFVMVLKKGDPITWAFGSLSSLFSGVFFPVGVLPGWLQGVSSVLPLTYTLDAIRHTVLQGYSLYQVRFDIIVLLGFALLLLPVALFSFRWAVRQAKAGGSLGQY